MRASAAEKSVRSYQQMLKRYVPKAAYPLLSTPVEEAVGSFYVDGRGKTYLDFTGGWGCAMMGHRNPEVLKAIHKQVDTGVLHTDFGFVGYRPYVELAKRLVQLTPGSTPKQAVFFTPGCEAVEQAVGFARCYTKRPGVLVFSSAFHGRTNLTKAMTDKEGPFKEGFGPFVPEVYRVPFPDPYRFAEPWKKMEKIIRQTVDPKKLACVVVEPVQGEGGFRVPMNDFLPGLREFTKKNGIVLIADEIQSGFGRTGKFFAFEHWGIEPDLILAGKAIANGLPLSAVIGDRKIFDSLCVGAIGGTFVGNPVACAAALAVLDVIEKNNLMLRAQSLGELMMSRFKQIQKNNPLVGDVRGKGAMVAMEFVKDQKTKEPAPEETAKLWKYLKRNGVLVATAGKHKNVFRLLIPLTIEKKDLERGLDIIEKGISMINQNMKK